MYLDHSPEGGSWDAEVQRLTSSGWVTIATVHPQGEYVVDFVQVRPGTYRVIVPDQGGYLGKTTKAFRVTGKQLDVYGKVIKSSKLASDVDPSRGDKSWTVKVDKLVSGKWKAYRTVHTKGDAEKVTVDVPHGIYRLRLPDQHGYLGGLPTDGFYIDR